MYNGRVFPCGSQINKYQAPIPRISGGCYLERGGSKRLHHFPHILDQLPQVLPHLPAMEDEGVRHVGVFLLGIVNGGRPQLLLVLSLKEKEDVSGTSVIINQNIRISWNQDGESGGGQVSGTRQMGGSRSRPSWGAVEYGGLHCNTSFISKNF